MTRQESGRIDGDIAISDELALSGMATGPITVLRGGSLQLNGMAFEGLTVNGGGRAHVNGVLRGLLTCAGDVELTGRLDGQIVVESGGQLLVAEGAARSSVRGPDLVMGAQGQWQPRGSDTYIIDDQTPRWPVLSD